MEPLYLYSCFLFYIFVVDARTCSRLDTLSLNTAIPEVTSGKTHRLMKLATRILYDSVVPLPVTKSSWKSTYCPVVEAGPFEDCKEAVGFQEDVSAAIEEYKRSGKALVPTLCDQGFCDGETEDFCLNPREMVLVPFGYRAFGQLSSSWIHHRCSREVRTEVLVLDVEIAVYDAMEFNLIIPGKGACFTNSTMRGCAIGTAEIIHAKDFHFNEVKNVSFPCLERNGETICYDNVTGNQFIWKEDSCTTLEGVCYCPVSYLNTSIGEPGKEAFVSIETIDEVTYQLQYENLEVQFDLTVLQKRITQLKRLVKSLILHAYKITADPLQDFLGVGIDQPTMAGDVIQGFVCTKGFPAGIPDKSPISKAKSTNLFSNADTLLDYERLKIKVPFLKKPPLTNSHLFNITKIKHGGAPVVYVRGLLDSIFLGSLLNLFHQISLILPWVNLFLLMSILLKR